MTAAGALDGVRVLDTSDSLGNYCGKLFADLGADVILVEPEHGTALRNEPTFTAAGHNLAFDYANSGKRSLVLNLDSQRGQFLALAAHADLILESHPPGWMPSRGLGFDALREVNPAIVLTSITPFGQSGPYAGRAGDDLLCSALGGMVALGGYPDSEPVVPAGEQAVLAANIFAAVASMLALTSAEVTGVGQHVDVAMLEAVVMGLENAPQYYDLEGVVRRRNGDVRRLAGTGTFETSDGYLCLLATGFGGTQHWIKLIDWLEDELETTLPDLHGSRWEDPSYLVTDEAKDLFAAVFEPFCISHDKASLYETGQRWRVPVCPVNSPSDVFRDAQLLARSAFYELNGSLVPGAPYRLSATPWRVSRPPPNLGEHTAEILAEIAS